MIAVGANETDEFKRQSDEFADALQRRGCKAEFHVVGDRKHSDLVFGLAESQSAFGGLVAAHFNDATASALGDSK